MTVTGLDPSSSQGDRAVVELLRRFGAQVTADGEAVTAAPGPLTGIELDAGPVPDLIPPLAVVAALARGETHIYNAGRLRLKESDRLAAVTALLTASGRGGGRAARRAGHPRRRAHMAAMRTPAATTASPWRRPSPPAPPMGR